MYFDINCLDKYNAIFNFVISSRSSGKSYSFKKLAIDTYLDKKEHSVILRRRLSEIDGTKLDNFFDDIREEYSEYELKVDRFVGYINDEPFLYFIPLSTQKNFKSIPYPKVTKLLFDEFLTTQNDNGSTGYLKDEITKFNELMSTIFRIRDNVKIYFFANNTSMVNPYFTQYNCMPKFGEDVTLIDKEGMRLVVLKFTNEEFVEKATNSTLGKFFKNFDSHYYNYAIANDSLCDKNDFVLSEVDKKNAERYLSPKRYLLLNDVMYSVKKDDNNNLIFSKSNEKSKASLYKITWAMNRNSLNEYSQLWDGSNEKKFFKNQYKRAKCYFDTLETKYYISEFLK